MFSASIMTSCNGRSTSIVFWYPWYRQVLINRLDRGCVNVCYLGDRLFRCWNETFFLRLTNSLSILRHTHISLKRFAPIYRKYFCWMIPGIFRKRFECCYPGLFNIHNRFKVSVNRFYFVADLHIMISLRGWIK